jgi:hypothetical protein
VREAARRNGSIERRDRAPGRLHSLFYPGDPAGETWVADQAVKILDGKAGHVAAGIRRRATRFGYSAAERAGADQCATYLTSKKPYLGYDTALAAGWPIATGVIEGACRHLVKDRMDITGTRWSLPGAEAILRLRALTANGDFDAYWAFHLRQEHEQTHWGRYQHPATSSPSRHDHPSLQRSRTRTGSPE